MAHQVVFSTSGAAVAFAATPASTPTFLTNSQAVAFFSTLGITPVFLTNSQAVAFTTTTSSTPIFLTAGNQVAFLVTPDTSTTKLLNLKIGDLSFNSDQTIVDVPDDTGVYDPVTNPGGFNPEGDPPVAGRPARSEVLLWTAYRIWSRPESQGYGITTQTPPNQNEESDVPYVFPLNIPTETVGQDVLPIRGIYEIAMMAVPLNEDFANNYVGDAFLIQRAEQYPDWYVTYVGAVVDPDLINCLNRKRYEFLQGVMCGKCDEDYLYFYGIYVGMINAMTVREWDRAVDFYNKLKEICGCDDSGSQISRSPCGC
jgi:hypothetical protein